MQTDNRLLDDLARMASGALGTLQGVRNEVDTKLRDQLARLLAGMDLVEREEFDAVKAMAAEARAENDRLAKRIAALEARLGSGDSATPAPAETAATPAAAAPDPWEKGSDAPT